MNFDLSREWLETNGIGGFASSSVIGCNTRRYHALLCAATDPPQGRVVLVNKIDENIIVKTPNGDRTFELGCNQYPGAIHPCGYQFLQEFHLDPLPRWIYEIPAAALGQGQSIRLEKTLWMPFGHNTTVVRYRLLSGPEVLLCARPFITSRDFHHIHRFNTDFNTQIQRHEKGTSSFSLQPYPALPNIVFNANGDFHEAGAWYYAFEYAIEQERGLDGIEDAYCPGALVWHLNTEQAALLAVSTDAVDLNQMAATCDTEIERRAQLQAPFADLKAENRDAAQRLALAADQFIVQRRDGLHTVLAGYPWFSDWGRDTMIALHGLCLTTGRFDTARSILLSFAKAASEGMIPNRFPDAGEIPDYNTIDATMWFFHATSKYLERSGDWETVQSTLFPTLRDCIEWHIRGTRFGIQADPQDGLLRGGDANTQLTWMDAKVGDTAFTPRHGKAVEIQALWYNALLVTAEFAQRAGDDATKVLCDEWSQKVRDNFAAKFWNQSGGYLYDWIDCDHKNAQIRPNQIFAVSLPHHLLSPEQERGVVETVQRELLTPHGLRSLSPQDEQYRGIYLGDQWQRDSGYHQGTVWGWPIGGFFSAYLQVHEHSADAKQQVRAWMEPLIQHLDEAGLNSISEIFDGDAPHTPRGCPQQAWSVAEVLRVLVEELN
jgi:predicted glycogen debranching enzyme